MAAITALEEIVVPAYDVVICGAGVGGLALARALGRQRRRVLLVEKHRTAREVYRGELLQPRSLEILDALGALPAVLARGALRVPRREVSEAASPATASMVGPGVEPL